MLRRKTHHKTYRFPTADIVVVGRECSEIPHGNPLLRLERPRDWVAGALRMLRTYRATGVIPTDPHPNEGSKP